MRTYLALAAILPLASTLHAQIEKYYPLDKGIVWEYQVEKIRRITLPQGEQLDEISGATTERIVDNIYPEFTVEGALILQQNVTQKSKISGGESHDTVNSLMTVDGETILIHGELPDGEPFNPDLLYTTPGLVIDFDKVLASEPFHSTMSMKGLTIEVDSSNYEYVTLETALGSLENVLQFELKGTISGEVSGGGQTLNVTDGKISETNWFAPGVGLVKQVQHMEMALMLGDQMIVKSAEDSVKTITGFTKE